MQNIKIDGEWVSVFDVCQAYKQLESDYNVGGILLERLSNQRRNMSIGVQLNRMKYNNLYDWVDITATRDKDNDSSSDDDVRNIYMQNVLKWNLPIDKPLAQQMKNFYTDDFLAQYKQRIEDALNSERDTYQNERE